MRHANKQDKDAVLNIWTQCFGADMRYQNILTANNYPLEDTFVLEVNDQVVSILTLLPIQWQGKCEVRKGRYVYGVATLPQYRGKGYSSKLMKEALSMLKEQGEDFAVLYPAEEAKDMQLHNDYEFKYEYTSRFRGLDDISITTSNPDSQGNLLMYRDSYGEAILPYMAEMFATAEFSRAVPYNLQKVSDGDSVIIELVERNLCNLLKSAPVMDAVPLGIADIYAEKGDSTDAVIKTAESNGMMHIYGILPESFFEGESQRILVEAEGTLYEAFTCFEDSLLDEYEYTPCGFSLYLPQGTNTDNIRITVLNENGRAVYADF